MLTMNSTAAQREERHPDGDLRARRRWNSGLGARHQGSAKGMSSASDRTSAPSAPSRAIRTGRMPAARAPSTSASGVSPTCQASSGRAPTSSSAAAKMAPSGFAEPISAEASAPSTSSASPVSCRRSCSDQSQLEIDRGPDPGRAQRPQRAARCPRRRGSAATPAARPGRRASRTAGPSPPRSGSAGPAATPGRGPRADAPGSRRSRPGSRPWRPARRCRRRSARAAPRAGAAPAARR